VDASRICAGLGGGGHARAAGCFIKGSLEQVKQIILEMLQKALLQFGFADTVLP